MCVLSVVEAVRSKVSEAMESRDPEVVMGAIIHVRHRLECVHRLPAELRGGFSKQAQQWIEELQGAYLRALR